jgi:crossover junction endodeoxyribonuclease RuvC
VKIVALDLSLTAPGWAMNEPQSSGVWHPAGLRGMPRLRWIRDKVAQCVTLADLVVIEGYSYGSKGRAVVNIGELGGVVRLALSDAGVPYVEIPPPCLKKLATGKGNTPKEAVLAAAIQRLGYGGYDHNEADALWLLEAARQQYELAGRVSLPQVHLAALAKVQWPVYREPTVC